MKRLIIALALLALLVISIAPSASAASVDVAGMQRNTGPDVEIYMPSTISLSELALVINYGDHDVILKITEANGTLVQSQVVSPHSSMFLELTFPDLTTYKITLSSQGYNAITLSRERSATVLPAPQDGGWHITPPSTQKPTYTQDMVNAIIAALTIETLLKATIAAIVGMGIGAVVKKATLFLVPLDILTITFCLIVTTDAFLNWTGMSVEIFYLPMLAGYFLGFLVTHVSYVMTEKDSLTEKTSVRQPVVLYSPNDEIGTCIQQQSNRALIKRWMGFHHRLGADAGIAPDWNDSTKYPYFPKFRKPLVMIEDSVTEYEDVPVFFGLLHVRVYTTYWRLSNASKFPKGLWKKSAASIIWARDMIDRLYADLVTERQRGRIIATQVAAEMHTYTIERSTDRAMYEVFQHQLPPMTIPEPQENVMRPATKAIASPQAMPEDTEPEETEKRRRKTDLEEEAEPEMNEKEETKKVKKNGRK